MGLFGLPIIQVGVRCNEPLPTIEQYQKPVSNSIPTIMRLFKSTTTKQINLRRGTPGEPVWQRNFYEHIVGSEKDYYAIAEYIENNPAGWETDQENPNDKFVWS